MFLGIMACYSLFYPNFSFLSIRNSFSELGRCGRVVSASDCQTGGLWFKSCTLPLLKHACGESDWLAIYTGKGVALEVNLRERISHTPLQAWIRLPNLALKPRGDVTRSLKQGYQWPLKMEKKFKKEKKSFLQN